MLLPEKTYKHRGSSVDCLIAKFVTVSRSSEVRNCFCCAVHANAEKFKTEML